jgi:hypothetical protein
VFIGGEIIGSYASEVRAGRELDGIGKNPGLVKRLLS